MSSPSNTNTLYGAFPLDFFKPLAARGSKIYEQISLKVYREYLSRQEPVDKETILTIITDILVERGLEAIESTDDAHGAFLGAALSEGDALRIRSNQILKYLSDRGWFRAPEIGGDLVVRYVIPGYACRFFELGAQMDRGEETSLSNTLYIINDLLAVAAEKPHSSHQRLDGAFRQTRLFAAYLSETLDAMRQFMEKMERKGLSIDAILKETCEVYLPQIRSGKIHKLNTTDNLTRFRYDITASARRLKDPDALEALTKSAKEGGDLRPVRDISDDLLDKIVSITETFDRIDGILASIRERDAQFLDAIAKKVTLSLSAYNTSSGQLHTVLQELAILMEPQAQTQSLGLTTKLAQPKKVEEAEEKIARITGKLFAASELKGLVPNFLPIARKKREPFVPVDIVKRKPTAEEIRAARQANTESLKKVMSRDKVLRRVNEAFRVSGLDVISASDLNVGDPEDIALIICIRETGKEDLGYEIEEKQQPSIRQGVIGFRDFYIKKRKAS